MIRHIVACDAKFGIAKNGMQPWKLPSDEAYFSTMTKRHGGIVAMGRKTFESIGAPLKERKNYVLTRDAAFSAEGVETVHDLAEVVARHDDVWVIGGGQVYAETLQLADELYITDIAANFDCDVFYPADLTGFVLKEQSVWLHENGFTFRYAVYNRSRL